MINEISTYEWLQLSNEDREQYEYVSDIKGCYFVLKEQEKEDSPDQEQDDFEKLFGGD